jgi:rubredoxin
VEVWEFQCPECRLGHDEFGRLLLDDEIFCPVCEHETGRQIKLQRWLPEEPASAQPRLRVVRGR